MKTIIALLLLSFAPAGFADLRVDRSHISFLATTVNSKGRFSSIRVHSKSERRNRKIELSHRCDEAWTLKLNCSHGPSRVQLCTLYVKFQPTRLGRQGCFATIDEIPGSFQALSFSGWGVEKDYWD